MKTTPAWLRALPWIGSLIESRDRRIAELEAELGRAEGDSAMLIERYELLTKNLAAAVVIRDRSGRITFCSPHTEVLTGYSMQEMYDAPEDFFLSIVHEEDRKDYLRAMKVIALGEPFQYTYRLYHQSGFVMWAETRTVPVLDEAGEVQFSLSISVDVTRNIKYQKQVEQQNRDLHDFTYMVSHDLKAPIFTIKGMMNLVDEELDESRSPEARDAVRYITEAVHRLELLVSSVLEYSKVAALKSSDEAVDLTAVLEQVVSDHRNQIEQAGARINVDFDLPVVIGDHLKLYQVFSNLIGNSIKYRSADRPLEIEVSMRPGKSRRTVCVAVQDNGMGVPSDKIDLIFRPFQRAHGPHIEGSGIGLACVKRLLEKLGGEVSVESEFGAGSTFLVVLKHFDV